MASFYHEDFNKSLKPREFEEHKIHKELENLKTIGERLIKDNMIIDSVGWINNKIKC